MDKLRYVFQQVMVTDGTRQLPDASIGKTFRVRCHGDLHLTACNVDLLTGCWIPDQVYHTVKIVVRQVSQLSCYYRNAESNMRATWW